MMSPDPTPRIAVLPDGREAINVAALLRWLYETDDADFKAGPGREVVRRLKAKANAAMAAQRLVLKGEPDVQQVLNKAFDLPRLEKQIEQGGDLIALLEAAVGASS